jgi:uncharacterized membrane protein SpoIIM required for sporulation
VIFDLPSFLAAERPYWEELDDMLNRLAGDPSQRLSLPEAQRMHYLYQRAASGLAKVQTFAAEPETQQYLEHLLARAYGEIHAVRTYRSRFRPVAWFFRTLPETFRKRWRFFAMSLAITLGGCTFGAGALLTDPDAKEVLMPFRHLLADPSERVAMEEQTDSGRRDQGKTSFSAFLMTHNTKVSIFTLALGVTFGVGSAVVLFSNGVMLGAVCADYIQAGEAEFLAGWLLPHGAVEIPCILIAGQAGLLLGSALLGGPHRRPLRARLREVTPDIVTLIFGIAILLVWAGIVEAFFSQYHEPVVPYAAKIVFGIIELATLFLFLGFSGLRNGQQEEKEAA